MKKFSNREVKEQILAAIGKEIDKRGEFQTTGIAFFGYEFDFKLNLTLVSRGERQMEISGKSQQERPTIEELKKILNSEDETPVTVLPDGSITAEPTKKVQTTIPVSGKSGKKSKKHGASKPSTAILANS